MTVLRDEKLDAATAATLRCRERVASLAADDSAVGVQLERLAKRPPSVENLTEREALLTRRELLHVESVAASDELRRMEAAEREAIRSALARAKADGLAEARSADGIALIMGDFFAPGDLLSRSSVDLRKRRDMRARPLPGSGGVYGTLAGDANAYGPEPIAIDPDHPVVSATVLDRPRMLGGGEGIAVLRPGWRDVTSVRLVCGPRGLIGIRVEGPTGAMLIPRFNLGHVVLDGRGAPGMHFLALGGLASVRLVRPPDEVADGGGLTAEVPAWTVVDAEARSGEAFHFGRSVEERLSSHTGQDVSLDPGGLGLRVRPRGAAGPVFTVIPWARVRCCTVAT